MKIKIVTPQADQKEVDRSKIRLAFLFQIPEFRDDLETELELMESSAPVASAVFEEKWKVYFTFEQDNNEIRIFLEDRKYGAPIAAGSLPDGDYITIPEFHIKKGSVSKEQIADFYWKLLCGPDVKKGERFLEGKQDPFGEWSQKFEVYRRVRIERKPVPIIAQEELGLTAPPKAKDDIEPTYKALAEQLRRQVRSIEQFLL